MSRATRNETRARAGAGAGDKSEGRQGVTLEVPLAWQLHTHKYTMSWSQDTLGKSSKTSVLISAPTIFNDDKRACSAPHSSHKSQDDDDDDGDDDNDDCELRGKGNKRSCSRDNAQINCAGQGRPGGLGKMLLKL